MTKQEIRKSVALLKRLGAESAKTDAEAVWNRLEGLEAFSSAGVVLAYCSLPDELDTGPLLERWAQKKKIAVPLVVGDDLVLKQYLPGHLHTGYKDILEPDADAPDIAPSEVEFAIIPGVAFDRNRNRLGRGKGFYDRFLPSLNCPTAGVAFPLQIFDELPTDPWDKPLDMIITAVEIITA